MSQYQDDRRRRREDDPSRDTSERSRDLSPGRSRDAKPITEKSQTKDDAVKNATAAAGMQKLRLYLLTDSCCGCTDQCHDWRKSPVGDEGGRVNFRQVLLIS